MPASRVLSHQTGDEHRAMGTLKQRSCSAVAVTLEEGKYVTLLRSAATITKLVKTTDTVIWPSSAGRFRWD